MPNKKGFTLVELIATVSIMLLITVIVTPNIMKQMEKGKERQYEQLKNQIISAAQNYYIKHKDTTSISLTNLKNEIDDEFIDENNNIVDPQTGKCLGGSVSVNRSGQNVTYSYIKNYITCS